MAKVRFQIDPHNLDKSAREAFDAHTNNQLSYENWKAVAGQIETLKRADTFRRTYATELGDTAHKDHGTKVAELQGLYEKAYDDAP